jgi:hypothetical protein
VPLFGCLSNFSLDGFAGQRVSEFSLACAGKEFNNQPRMKADFANKFLILPYLNPCGSAFIRGSNLFPFIIAVFSRPGT